MGFRTILFLGTGSNRFCTVMPPRGLSEVDRHSYSFEYSIRSSCFGWAKYCTVGFLHVKLYTIIQKRLSIKTSWGWVRPSSASVGILGTFFCQGWKLVYCLHIWIKVYSYRETTFVFKVFFFKSFTLTYFGIIFSLFGPLRNIFLYSIRSKNLLWTILESFWVFLGPNAILLWMVYKVQI